MVVVDGRIGYVGGSGIEDHYNDERFYDVMCRVEGPIVAQLQSVFLLSWRHHDGPAPDDASLVRYFPPTVLEVPADAPFRAPTTVLWNVPGTGHHPISDAIERAIEDAAREIHIVNPYISNRAILERLLAAALRGVRVRLIAPGKPTPPYPAAAFRHWYGRLIDAGVEILLHPEMAHAKVLRIDDEVLIGGCNLDDLSLFRNDELDLRFDDPAVAELTERTIFDELASMSTPAERATGAAGTAPGTRRWTASPVSCRPSARSSRHRTEDRCTTTQANVTARHSGQRPHEGSLSMSIGPVEYIAIAFPGNKFSGEIIPAIKELQDSGTIRVLDLVIISKDADGNVAAIELAEASPETQATFAVLGVENKNLLGEEDFEDIGSALDPNSTAALMIWENVWAAEFAQVAAQRRRDPHRQRPHPGRAGRGTDGVKRLLILRPFHAEPSKGAKSDDATPRRTGPHGRHDRRGRRDGWSRVPPSAAEVRAAGRGAGLRAAAGRSGRGPASAGLRSRAGRGARGSDRWPSSRSSPSSTTRASCPTRSSPRPRPRRSGSDPGNQVDPSARVRLSLRRCPARAVPCPGPVAERRRSARSAAVDSAGSAQDLAAGAGVSSGSTSSVSSTCSTVRQTADTTPRNGTTRNMPMIPAISLPAGIATSTTAGCRLTTLL